MAFWQIITLLLSGGLLGAGGTIAGTIIQNQSEEHRAKRKREEEIADRKFNLKREAYFEALKEFNQSGLSRFSGIGDRPLTPEEISNRNAAMTLFDMYAPNHIKSKAALVIRNFHQDLPQNPQERQTFNDKVINDLRELTEEVKKDLGFDIS